MWHDAVHERDRYEAHKKKHLVISSERGGLERSILSSAEVDPKIRKFSIKKVVDVSS